jgi:hypothetical protein
MLLQPGDIILTRSDGILGRLIRYFETHPGESEALYNHVGVVTEAGDEKTAIMVEALWKTRHGTVWEGYGRKKGQAQIAIYRPNNIPPEKLEIISTFAETFVGDSYGWWKLLAHAADWRLSHDLGREVYIFRKLLFIDKYPICSFLVAKAFSAAGYDFGVPPNEASPDDIADFINSNPEKYTLIFGPGRLA